MSKAESGSGESKSSCVKISAFYLGIKLSEGFIENSIGGATASAQAIYKFFRQDYSVGLCPDEITIVSGGVKVVFGKQNVKLESVDEVGTESYQTKSRVKTVSLDEENQLKFTLVDGHLVWLTRGLGRVDIEHFKAPDFSFLRK